MHSDESNLASGAEACERAKTISRIDLRLACGTYKRVESRGCVGGVGRQLRNLRFTRGNLFTPLLFLSFSLPPSAFPASHDAVSRGKFTRRVFARNESPFSSRAFILPRIRDPATLDAHIAVCDICDLIIAAICGENLQFQMQSIRKFCLIMVITDTSCNL